VLNTNLAACGGGVAWSLLEYLHTRKFSIIGFCSGIIGGLVGITAAAGFVPVYTSCLIGFLTSISCFYCNKYKYLIGIDEGLDIWALHGMGGIVGDILTGFFAADFVNAMDGATTTNPGGWWNRHWAQMGYQLAAALTCAAWSFTISCLLLFVINKIPGLHLRVTEEEELQGLDQKYFSDCDMDFFGMGQYGSSGDAESGHITGVRGVTTPPSESQEQKRD
jgi:Amt family ammonium transporter